MTKAVVPVVASLFAAGLACAQDQRPALRPAMAAADVSAQERSDTLEEPPLPFGGEVFTSIAGTAPTPPSGSGYQPRTSDTVYSCGDFGGRTTHAANCSHVLEDIRFTPGIWTGQATSRIITEISYGVAVVTTPVANNAEQILLVFWDEDDVNFQGVNGAGSGMIRPTATPLAVVRINPGALGAGFYYQLTQSLTSLPGGGVTVPAQDDGIALEIAWVSNGCTPAAYQDLGACVYGGCNNTADRSIVFSAPTSTPVGGNPASPGSTSISHGRDLGNMTMCPNIGRFVGNGAAPVTTGDVEHRTAVGAGTQLGLMVRLRGEIEPECCCWMCPPRLDLRDSGSSVSGNVTPGDVKWFTIFTRTGILDENLQFLDLDTETSTGVVDIALYSGSDGRLLGVDHAAGGSPGHSQLSFGIGRRAQFSPGTGSQYDGRHGQVPGPAYHFVAVAPQGSQFLDGFELQPSSAPGGNFTIRASTNLQGTPAAPSVAPLINHVDYGNLDPVAGGSSPGSVQPPSETGVLWSRFTLMSGVGQSQFLDITFDRLSNPSADAVAYLFDSAGNIRYYSDDEGPGALPRFSLGGRGENLPPGGAAGLEAGTYYLAVCGAPAADLRATSSAHRWHVRGSTLTTGPLGADLEAGTRACGTSDFNGDGDFGTDQDIEAFFACLGGNCCPTCWHNGAHFNGDGDVGTDQDIEAFFRVLGGAEC